MLCSTKYFYESNQSELLISNLMEALEMPMDNFQYTGLYFLQKYSKNTFFGLYSLSHARMKKSCELDFH